MITSTEHELRRALDREAALAVTPPTPAILHGLGRRQARQRRQAVLASVSVLAVVAAVLAVAFGSASHPNRVTTLAPASYQQACAVEPDVCLPGTAGAVPSGLARPLHLPKLAAGARCPATSGLPSARSYLRGQEYGAGPARFVIDQKVDVDRIGPASRTTAFGRAEQSGWLAATSNLLISPGYRGPVLVRGQRLDGSGAAFFDGSSVTSYLDPPYPDANTQSDGARTPPASIFVRSPGCYGFQIDGTTFSTVVVLDVTAPGK